MRKNTLLFAAVILLAACQKTDKPGPEEPVSQITQRKCAADEILQRQMAEDPALQQRMQDIEAFTQKAVLRGEALRNTAGEMVVPVVVHILYRTVQENVSDAQVKSQIDVLNEDFNLQNKDIANVPQVFQALKGSTGIRFQLAKVIRKQTAVTSWPANDAMKYTSKGGSDVVDPDHNLNIWVCNLQDYLGYAQFPGGNPATDGVVIWYLSFGRTGKLEPRFDKGRTATHEVGHWMNLHHIWGDVYCGNDLVGDTPQATIYNFGCPSFPHYNSCHNKEIEMTMNYMDYTDDACMFMFTKGQSDRMNAIFTNGGPRAAFF